MIGTSMDSIASLIYYVGNELFLVTSILQRHAAQAIGRMPWSKDDPVQYAIVYTQYKLLKSRHLTNKDTSVIIR